MDNASGHRHASARIGSCHDLLRRFQEVTRIRQPDGKAAREQRQSVSHGVRHPIGPNQGKSMMAGG